MASQHSGRNSRRGGRGGSRRRRNDARARQQPTAKTAPTSKGLWAKITSFFGVDGDGKTTPERNGTHSSESREAQPRPSRKPQSVEVTSGRLYVGNLSFDATESDLFDLFNGVGQVQNAEIVSYRHNQRSKGFAFVQMLTVDEARRAVSELHDKEFMGRKLVVSGAKANDHARG